MGFELIKKEKRIRNRGQYIRIRNIYSILGVPIFFYDKRIAYDKYFYDDFILKKLYGNDPITLAVGEYIVKSPNIVEKVQNLIANVPLKEVENILLIIKRLSDVYQSQSHSIEIKNPSELDTLRQIQVDFIERILKLNENVYLYGGYFLPISFISQ